MKNSILNYKTIEFTDLIVTDYTSYNYAEISNLSIFNDETYVYYYTLNDGETIEGVSYKAYNTTDYWDLILLINRKSALFDMSYDFDALSVWARLKAEEYNFKEYFGSSLPRNHILYLESLYLNELTLKNEENRVIKLVKPSMLNDVFRILREKSLI